MSFTVVIKDANGDVQSVPVADNPPENTVLQDINTHMASVDSTLAAQASTISDIHDTLGDVHLQTQSVANKVDDVKDAVTDQSYYVDMMHLDAENSSQLDDNNSLNTPVDAIVCMTSGKVHVETANGGERTIPVLAGVPHKCRITQIYETGTTASDIVGYVEGS